MQSGVNALCYFRSIERAVKEAIYIATLVSSRQQIVETPHIQLSTLTEDDMMKIATLNKQDTGNFDFNEPTFVRSLINLKA